MRPSCLIAIGMLASVGCAGSAPPREAAGVATRDSVAAMFHAIPAVLAEHGPLGWLETFEDSPAFRMSSDGEVVFPSRDSAAAFLTAFAPTVSRMEITWHGVRIEPLAPGVASIGAGYDETIIRTDGSALRFGGYVTAVARSHDGRWRLQQLHWSSPRNDER